uniref:DUF676 domain-containing protein n=1 Tax=Opuntia streptacantha TaxID=393608 RepID=A0A7C9EGT3_OPUST
MILSNSQFIKPPTLNSSFFRDKNKVPLWIPLRCTQTAAFWTEPGRMGSGCCGDWLKKKKQQQQLSGVGENVEIERVADGVDLMDAAMAEANVCPPHLVIMVNGLIGSASDWKFAGDQFVKQLPDKVVVHRSQCNPAKLTFDGVDLMGERLAHEVLTVVRHRPGLQKISFIAHSLGGLVARYAIGRLYEPLGKLDPSVVNGNCLEKENSIYVGAKLKEDCRGIIAGLEAMNFITVATPHLGSRGHKQFCSALFQKVCCICKCEL